MKFLILFFSFSAFATEFTGQSSTRINMDSVRASELKMQATNMKGNALMFQFVHPTFATGFRDLAKVSEMNAEALSTRTVSTTPVDIDEPKLFY